MEFPVEGAVVRAVAGATFSVTRGETVALVGESGSGKSVSALAVMGLLDPPGRVVGGDVRIDGQPVLGLREDQWRTLRGRQVAMVFQDPMTSLNPSHRIGRQVAEAIRVHDHARVEGRRPGVARSRCSNGWGSRPPPSGPATTRTSSRAVSASG